MLSLKLNHIINFANKLRSNGLVSEANQIEQMVEDYSTKVIDPRFVNIFDDINSELEKLNISHEDKNKVMEMVNKLKTSKYLKPQSEYYAPSGSDVHFVPQEAINVAMAYAEYYKSLKEIDKNDTELHNRLKEEYLSEENALEGTWRKMMEYKKKNPIVFEKIRSYIDYALNEPELSKEIRLYPERRNS